MSDPLHQLGSAQAAGVEADALLRQIQKPLAELEAEYVRRWRTSAYDKPQDREDAWLMLRALEELRTHLSVQAKGGAITAFNLRRSLAAKPTRG
jgi:hypothetical protein